VSENRVLRRIFQEKMEEEARGWRKLQNKKLHNFIISPNIIRVIKPRRIICTGHAAHIGDTRNACRISVRKPEGK
jgi:hypothetical protein